MKPSVQPSHLSSVVRCRERDYTIGAPLKGIERGILCDFYGGFPVFFFARPLNIQISMVFNAASHGST